MGRKKPTPRTETFAYNLVYEDGTLSSNRRVTGDALAAFEGKEEDAARAFFEAQDRDIAVKSGMPRGPIKTIKRAS